MNEPTNRDRDDDSQENDRSEHGSNAGVGRRRGHDPVLGEIDVDGAPMAVDRCRHCGIVVLDSRRPGGPCPGPNHTLTDFGVTPPADHEEEADPSVARSGSADARESDARVGYLSDARSTVRPSAYRSTVR